jgi:hypothetical protein
MKKFNEWMDAQGITPEAAAEIFRKSVGTIRNWRSLGVPESQLPWVEKIMAEHDARGQSTSRDRIWLDVTDDQLRSYIEAAKHHDLYFKEWALSVLDEAAAAEDATVSGDGLDPVIPVLRVADDPGDYAPKKEMGA